MLFIVTYVVCKMVSMHMHTHKSFVQTPVLPWPLVCLAHFSHKMYIFFPLNLVYQITFL